MFVSAHVIGGVLADNFELVKHDPQESISGEQLRASRLRGWGRSEGSDFFEAKYKGISFVFSNVKLYDERIRGETILDGQWLVLDLRKEMPGALMISGLEKEDRLDKATVQIEQFAVRTEFPELVSEVLTPAFVLFLLSMRPRVHLFFEGKQLYFGVDAGKYLFEPWFKVQEIPALRERVQREIDDIKRIIDGCLLLDWLFQEE